MIGRGGGMEDVIDIEKSVLAFSFEKELWENTHTIQ